MKREMHQKFNLIQSLLNFCCFVLTFQLSGRGVSAFPLEKSRCFGPHSLLGISTCGLWQGCLGHARRRQLSLRQVVVVVSREIHVSFHRPIGLLNDPFGYRLSPPIDDSCRGRIGDGLSARSSTHGTTRRVGHKRRGVSWLATTLWLLLHVEHGALHVHHLVHLLIHGGKHGVTATKGTAHHAASHKRIVHAHAHAHSSTGKKGVVAKHGG